MVWYISKALGLQSGSQVVCNKSVPMLVDGAIYRHDETCMHGDLPLLSQTGSIAVNCFTQS